MSHDRSPLSPAALRWAAGQPLSTRFQDVYFSRESGPAEVRHVFIDGNDLEPRFRSLPADEPGRFCIGETGFGTGLSLLVTLELWLRTAPPGWQLHWLTTELYPLDSVSLRRAHALWPERAGEATLLQAAYPPPTPGRHHRWLLPGRVSLELWQGDATEGLASLRRIDASTRIDAWFLDGFAPARNPAMWQPELFQQLANWSRPGTTLATFTAAGSVRRGLQAQGFAVARSPGFGRKRDMIRGHFTGLTEEPSG